MKVYLTFSFPYRTRLWKKKWFVKTSGRAALCLKMTFGFVLTDFSYYFLFFAYKQMNRYYRYKKWYFSNRFSLLFSLNSAEKFGIAPRNRTYSYWLLFCKEDNTIISFEATVLKRKCFVYGKNNYIGLGRGENCEFFLVNTNIYICHQ